MAQVDCPEPAVGATQCAVTAGPNDSVKFPHVDVCLGIGFILTNGHLVGGHVPMQWGANQNLDLTSRTSNAERILTAMMRLVTLERRSAVSKVVTIGDDINIWTNLGALLRNINAPGGHLHLRTSGFGGGADLIIDAAASTVHAVGCTATTHSYNCTFAQIGTRVVPL